MRIQYSSNGDEAVLTDTVVTGRKGANTDERRSRLKTVKDCRLTDYARSDPSKGVRSF